MFGVIYVETNPFLSLRCIASIRTFRLAPFSPIVDNNVLNRFNLASSRLEVEGVVGVVWLYACMAVLLNVTQTKDAFWLYSGSGRLASRPMKVILSMPHALPPFCAGEF